MSGAVPEGDREVSQRIGLAWRELRRGAAMASLRDRLFGTGFDSLEPGQYDTLEALVQRPAWRMSEIAEALRVDPSTATRAVQRLARSGLADRRPSPEDGRVVMVSASDAGRRRFEAIALYRRAFMADVLSVFDDDERRQLADLLDRLVRSLDRAAASRERGPAVGDPQGSA